MRQKVFDNGGSVTTVETDYVGPFHYEDADGDGSGATPEILFFSHEEGRVRRAGNELVYESFLKDHLGNVRVMFADMNGDGWVDPNPVNGEVLQIDHYYPFGLRMAGLSLVPAVKNSYLFTGKEAQDELSLGWIDFGARMYDAASSRWNGVDALGERYISLSPFHYSGNNPTSFLDIDGNSFWHSSFLNQNGGHWTDQYNSAEISSTQSQELNQHEQLQLIFSKVNEVLADSSIAGANFSFDENSVDYYWKYLLPESFHFTETVSPEKYFSGTGGWQEAYTTGLVLEVRHPTSKQLLDKITFNMLVGLPVQINGKIISESTASDFSAAAANRASDLLITTHTAVQRSWWKDRSYVYTKYNEYMTMSLDAYIKTWFKKDAAGRTGSRININPTNVDPRVKSFKALYNTTIPRLKNRY
ncbi:MAG: RHS repeat-associated core domain-containing protein [Bacteroidia bacterium]